MTQVGMSAQLSKRAGAEEMLGRNRNVLVFAYEPGSLFDQDYPSYPGADWHLFEDNQSIGQDSPVSVGTTAQDGGQTPAGQSPANIQVSTGNALQCTAMYCAKGGLCCEGYTCSPSPIAFAEVLNFVLLGIQQTIGGIVSSCVLS